METSINIKSPKKMGRLAGLLYVLIAFSGAFSIGYVPTVIMETGDPTTILANLASNKGLVQGGLLADIAIIIMEVVITILLYQLTKQVSKTLSLIAAISRFAMVVVMGMNLLNLLVPLMLVGDSSYIGFESQAQLESLVMFMLRAHEIGIIIWGLFFGLHLLVLGYLVMKSGYFPKVLGILLILGSLGYLFESTAELTMTNNVVISSIFAIFLAFAIIGELSFAIWLLVKGLRTEKWSQQRTHMALAS